MSNDTIRISMELFKLLLYQSELYEELRDDDTLISDQDIDRIAEEIDYFERNPFNINEDKLREAYEIDG